MFVLIHEDRFYFFSTFVVSLYSVILLIWIFNHFFVSWPNDVSQFFFYFHLIEHFPIVFGFDFVYFFNNFNYFFCLISAMFGLFWFLQVPQIYCWVLISWCRHSLLCNSVLLLYPIFSYMLYVFFVHFLEVFGLLFIYSFSYSSIRVHYSVFICFDAFRSLYSG